MSCVIKRQACAEARRRRIIMRRTNARSPESARSAGSFNVDFSLTQASSSSPTIPVKAAGPTSHEQVAGGSCQAEGALRKRLE